MNNQQLIELWYHEMWNQWNRDILPEILDKDITFRGSLGRTCQGYDELLDYIAYIQNAFPDFTNTIDLIITEGDQSFAKLTYTGTHQQEVFGIPATGKQIQYHGSAIFTFRDNKIVDVWVLGDIYGLIQQLKS